MEREGRRSERRMEGKRRGYIRIGMEGAGDLGYMVERVSWRVICGLFGVMSGQIWIEKGVRFARFGE
jgi:hypothetical protein